MRYCVMCGTAMLERTVDNEKVLMCSMCGMTLKQIGENSYKYIGTTHGNQQLRELLATIDNNQKGTKPEQ